KIERREGHEHAWGQARSVFRESVNTPHEAEVAGKRGLNENEGSRLNHRANQTVGSIPRSPVAPSDQRSGGSGRRGLAHVESSWCHRKVRTSPGMQTTSSPRRSALRGAWLTIHQSSIEAPAPGFGAPR